MILQTQNLKDPSPEKDVKSEELDLPYLSKKSPNLLCKTTHQNWRDKEAASRTGNQLQ